MVGGGGRITGQRQAGGHPGQAADARGVRRRLAAGGWRQAVIQSAHPRRHPWRSSGSEELPPEPCPRRATGRSGHGTARSRGTRPRSPRTGLHAAVDRGKARSTTTTKGGAARCTGSARAQSGSGTGPALGSSDRRQQRANQCAGEHALIVLERFARHLARRWNEPRGIVGHAHGTHKAPIELIENYFLPISLVNISVI